MRDPRTKPTGRYKRLSGGKFSEARPWGYIDWALKSASGKPGPAAYSPKLLPRLRGAARFSNVTPKSYIDWAVYFAKDVPGPADYDIELCR